ncbi:hypothetical protein MMC07_007022 [Pseudocyphellaria aurata]|nr:hypothetical protein [Pseudocyphellaria aurata]
MTTLHIPDIAGAVSQMETSVHPDAVEVSQACNEWFGSYNLMSQPQWDEMLKMEYGLATARGFPNGDKERLRLATDWFTLLFNYDDLLDDSTSDLTHNESGASEASKIMLSVLLDTDNFQPTSRLPVAAAFHRYSWTRFQASSSPSSQKRFIDSVIGYAMAAAKQTGIRESRMCPSLEEFIALRRETGAVKTCYPFVQHMLEIDVPDKAWHHPIIESLHEVDISSFNREQAAGDHQNLVAIVSVTKDIPVQIAMEYVFLMYQWAVNQWFQLLTQIPKFDPETDEIVSKYIRGLEHLVSGLTHWTFDTERYFGPQRHEVKDTMRVTVLPLEPWAAEPVQKLKYAVF